MQVVVNPIVKCALIELVIPDNTRLQQIPFPDQPYLRNKQIQAFHASPSQVCAASGRKNWGYDLGIGTASIVALPVYLTLVDENNAQFVQNMPVLETLAAKSDYDTASTAIGIYNTNGIPVMEPRTIVWPKSFVYFPVAPTAISGYSLQLQVYYV